MLIYAITVFLSAFLLFQVQLISAKTILPWFGGSPAVWTTCNLFFQGLLLTGYAYGHATIRRLSPRTQGFVHASLLLASLGLAGALARSWNSPITPPASWRPQGSSDPIIHILAILLISVGLPYFLLSATAPMLQAWLGRTRPQATVYRLYALSNLGSLIALVSYPFVVEPRLTLQTQARVWSWTYGAFALGCAYCAVKSGAFEASPEEHTGAGNQISHVSNGTLDGRVTPAGHQGAPSKGLCAIWLGLAACASVLFLATTNQLCQEVAVIPLLWVLPLSVYLLSFILCFARETWYSRRWFHPAFGAALLAACFVLYGGVERSLSKQIVCYVAVLFVSCMVCHGELAKLKPDARFLTLFYLMVASGGVFGGITVALLAPHLLPGFWEYQAGLLAAALLVLAVLRRDKDSWLQTSGMLGALAVLATAVLMPVFVVLAIPTLQSARKSVFFIVALLALLFLVNRRKRGVDASLSGRSAAFYCGASIFILTLVLAGSLRARAVSAIASFRNFYGVLTVRAQDAGDPAKEAYALSHGLTVHGYQFRAESKRRLPTSYFGPQSGIGLAMKYSHAQAAKAAGKPSGLRIGVVGLGVGTIATYGRVGDSIRFYEINPEVIRLATDSTYFTYVPDSAAKVDVAPGDARISLEGELQHGQQHDLDVLAIDAFSGDAVPVHLLTAEAFQIYLQRLKPRGILTIHVSNRFLDLKRVVVRAADEMGIPCVWVQSQPFDMTTNTSDWMLLSHDKAFLNSSDVEKSRAIETVSGPRTRLWTDDYSNLFQVLKKQ